MSRFRIPFRTSRSFDIIFSKGLFGFGVLVFMFFSNDVVSQNRGQTIKAQISADSILIGDQVEFSLSAKVGNKQNVRFPLLVDTLVTGIELLHFPVIDTVKCGKDSLALNYRVSITSFDEGYYRIPPYQLVVEEGEQRDTVSTKPIYFLVNTIAPDSTILDIYDIKQPLREPITFAEVAPWAFGGLLVVALVVFLIYYIIRRRQNKPIFFPLKPKEPAHIIALRKLNGIKEQKQWQSDDAKGYYSLLTDVLRQYMELRFGINAMEQTTHEIISSLQPVEGIEKELLHELFETLSLADLVKFARFTSSYQEKEAALTFAFRFVEETKEEEKPDEEEDKADGPDEMSESNRVVVESGKTVE